MDMKAPAGCNSVRIEGKVTLNLEKSNLTRIILGDVDYIEQFNTYEGQTSRSGMPDVKRISSIRVSKQHHGLGPQTIFKISRKKPRKWSTHLCALDLHCSCRDHRVGMVLVRRVFSSSWVP